MDATLLGSGDATGVPVPLCGCEYCLASNRRRRPALIVETERTTLLFDAGPDINEQLSEVGVTDVDAIYLTHGHGDHADGLLTVSQGVKWDADHLDRMEEFGPVPDAFEHDFDLNATETALEHLAERGALTEFLSPTTIAARESTTVGDVHVRQFRVDHHRPTCDTLGFVAHHEGRTVGYAPDVRTFVDHPPPMDLLVVEGAALLGAPVHGPTDVLRATIDGVDAERVVLVNVSEHLQRKHTDELERIAAEHGCELGTDFATYEVP